MFNKILSKIIVYIKFRCNHIVVERTYFKVMHDKFREHFYTVRVKYAC